MNLARGMQEVLAMDGRFASPAEAGAFWMVGGAEVATRDLSYRGGAGQDQRLRLYRGAGPEAPTLIYVHGGGWVGGSIELHDYSARGMAVAAPCNVVSLSYRFAPDHPYPAGLTDCLAAVGWLHENGPGLGLNTERLLIGGASAGANLAAAAALSRDRAVFAGLLIFYGVLGCDFDTPSYQKYRNGPGLTRARMQELFGMYDPDGQRARDPLIAPLQSDRLGDLPPTCIIAAEHDVLLDENRAMAEALRQAGVPTDFHIEPGVTHGFINRGRLVPAADASIARAGEFLTRPAQRKTA
ncbi:MAG: alpha/beta hydrolase [Rhodobacter sp.]|nr:alpha/beta hydrolase [Rhodobacter sp.]